MNNFMDKQAGSPSILKHLLVPSLAMLFSWLHTWTTDYTTSEPRWTIEFQTTMSPQELFISDKLKSTHNKKNALGFFFFSHFQLALFLLNLIWPSATGSHRRVLFHVLCGQCPPSSGLSGCPVSHSPTLAVTLTFFWSDNCQPLPLGCSLSNMIA